MPREYPFEKEEPEKHSPDIWAYAFNNLSRSKQRAAVEVAKTQTADCSLCRLIIHKERKQYLSGQEIFPEIARRAHLMLHCVSSRHD